MKRRIKIIASTLSVAALTVPALAMAQFNPNTAQTQAKVPKGSIFAIISTIMKWLLGLVGFLGIIGFAIAGILYLTAAGDEDRIKTAKTAMLYSIIGVIVAILGYVIMQAAQTMLNGTNTTF